MWFYLWALCHAHIFTGEIGIMPCVVWLRKGIFSEWHRKINKLGPNMDLNQIPFIGILICLLLWWHWMCSEKGTWDQIFYINIMRYNVKFIFKYKSFVWSCNTEWMNGRSFQKGLQAICEHHSPNIINILLRWTSMMNKWVPYTV